MISIMLVKTEGNSNRISIKWKMGFFSPKEAMNSREDKNKSRKSTRENFNEMSDSKPSILKIKIIEVRVITDSRLEFFLKFFMRVGMLRKKNKPKFRMKKPNQSFIGIILIKIFLSPNTIIFNK